MCIVVSMAPLNVKPFHIYGKSVVNSVCSVVLLLANFIVNTNLAALSHPATLDIITVVSIEALKLNPLNEYGKLASQTAAFVVLLVVAIVETTTLPVIDLEHAVVASVATTA